MTAFPAHIRLGTTIRPAAEVVSVSEAGQLMVTDRPTKQGRERVGALPATLGRASAGAAVVLADNPISRRHARLEIVDDELTLIDLGSANGTFVNDARVTRHVLAPGDLMRIGR